jgi:hypothetical protein
MNPFLSDYTTRLHVWKQLRDQIHECHWVDDQIDLTLKFWRHAPEERTWLDWDQPHTWPGAWDLMHENRYCVNSHSLGIAYTLLLADPVTYTDLKLQLVWDKTAQIQKIMVHTHGQLLNYGSIDKVDQNLVKDVNILNTYTWNQKSWQITRPK